MNAKIPEDTKPDYDATPPTEYTVRFEKDDGSEVVFPVTSSDTAEYLHEQGAIVGPARTGWEK